MSTDDHGIKWRRNFAENINRLSRVHERNRRQADRQTTDGRTMTYSEREFTFAEYLRYVVDSNADGPMSSPHLV